MRTGVFRVASSPSPSCPRALAPHPYSSPALVTHNVWSPPALTATISIPTSASTRAGFRRERASPCPSCPSAPSPRVSTRRVAVRSTVCPRPAAHATTRVVSSTPTQYIQRGVRNVFPSPSSPWPVLPLVSAPNAAASHSRVTTTECAAPAATSIARRVPPPSPPSRSPPDRTNPAPPPPVPLALASVSVESAAGIVCGLLSPRPS